MELKSNEFQCFRCEKVFRRTGIKNYPELGLAGIGKEMITIDVSEQRLEETEKISLCDTCNKIVQARDN